MAEYEALKAAREMATAEREKFEREHRGHAMVFTQAPITGDEASKAMLDGLTNLIRDKLRERIMARLKPDIDAAIEEALSAFKVTIESYHEMQYMRDTIRVLVENKTVQ